MAALECLAGDVRSDANATLGDILKKHVGMIPNPSSTTAFSVVTFTPAATGTKRPVHLARTIEGASTSGTVLNVMIMTGSSTDAITVYRGSKCWLS